MPRLDYPLELTDQSPIGDPYGWREVQNYYIKEYHKIEKEYHRGLLMVVKYPSESHSCT